MNFLKILIFFFICINIIGCNEKTIYSGKYLTAEQISKMNFKNKNDLLDQFGQPSYVDFSKKKYFYYTEKNKSKNFYNKKNEYSYLFVFEINDNDEIISSQSINLLDQNDNKFEKKITENNLIKRGILEKIFGGVGPNPNQLPNSQ